MHLACFPRKQWLRELGFIAVVGLVGWLLDSALHVFGAIGYATSEPAWGLRLSPPWILGLWLGFASMPRFSLAWLGRYPWGLAAAFGAVGGALAFYSGTRLGAIEAGLGLSTYALLLVEYALLTPLMMLSYRRLVFPGHYGAGRGLQGSVKAGDKLPGKDLRL
ncbi:MAG: DUF2878 family protein [Planctomycetota bacterium]|nr:DUF2878 family protein [Planctomycetota bacterium]